MSRIFLNFIIILSVSLFCLMQAQALEGEVRLQRILPQEAQLGTNVTFDNIDFGRGPTLPLDVSANGEVFLPRSILDADKLIKKEGDSFRVVEIPLIDELKANRLFSRAELSDDGNWLIIFASTAPFPDPERQNEVIFYDVENEQVSTTFNPKIPPNAFNHDATIMVTARSQDHSAVVIERQGTEFSETPIARGGSYLSSSGDRIFAGDSIMDRLPSGDWSEPKEIIIRDDEGNPLNFNIRDIAQNGRRILGKAFRGRGSDSISVGTFVADDQDGKWIPQFIDPGGYTGAISEDGKVAIGRPNGRKIGSIVVSDLVVFIETSSGEWVKRQINPPNVGILGFSFPKGGTQLFYSVFPDPVPASIPDSPVFDN